MPQHYYVFNTGGVGADTNEEASGPTIQEDSEGTDPDAAGSVAFVKR